MASRIVATEVFKSAAGLGTAWAADNESVTGGSGSMGSRRYKLNISRPGLHPDKTACCHENGQEQTPDYAVDMVKCALTPLAKRIAPCQLDGHLWNATCACQCTPLQSSRRDFAMNEQMTLCGID
jgi:hypothetical protein